MQWSNGCTIVSRQGGARATARLDDGLGNAAASSALAGPRRSVTQCHRSPAGLRAQLGDALVASLPPGWRDWTQGSSDPWATSPTDGAAGGPTGAGPDGWCSRPRLRHGSVDEPAYRRADRA